VPTQVTNQPHNLQCYVDELPSASGKKLRQASVKAVLGGWQIKASQLLPGKQLR